MVPIVASFCMWMFTKHVRVVRCYRDKGQLVATTRNKCQKGVVVTARTDEIGKKIKSQAEKGWERQKGPSHLGAAAREETRTSNMYSFHIHTQKSLAIFLFHLACPLHLAWFVQ